MRPAEGRRAPFITYGDSNSVTLTLTMTVGSTHPALSIKTRFDWGEPGGCWLLEQPQGWTPLPPALQGPAITHPACRNCWYHSGFLSEPSLELLPLFMQEFSKSHDDCAVMQSHHFQKGNKLRAECYPTQIVISRPDIRYGNHPHVHMATAPSLVQLLLIRKLCLTPIKACATRGKIAFP